MIKQALNARIVQMVGDQSRSVTKIAIACGAGSEFIAAAANAGADVLLTGEARFHDDLAARALGLALLLPGHYASERLGAEDLALRLGTQWPELKVWASHKEQDPLSHI
jgi:putative NIF3 family GTP cyclohydrolase 1 type 2